MSADIIAMVLHLSEQKLISVQLAQYLIPLQTSLGGLIFLRDWWTILAYPWENHSQSPTFFLFFIGPTFNFNFKFFISPWDKRFCSKSQSNLDFFIHQKCFVRWLERRPPMWVNSDGIEPLGGGWASTCVLVNLWSPRYETTAVISLGSDQCSWQHARV